MENVRHLTVVDVLFPAGGFLALLFIATPLLGHAVTKDGYDAGLGDSDDVVYGYYPMM